MSKNKKQSDKNECNFETMRIYVQKLNYIKYFDPIRSKYFSQATKCRFFDLMKKWVIQVKIGARLKIA